MSVSHKAFNKLDKRELSLVIGLSSGDVHVNIVYTERGQKPVIISSVSKEVPFMLDPSVQVMRTRTIKVLDEALKELARVGGDMYSIKDLMDSHQKINKTFVYLSPMWGEYVYDTVIHDYQKPTTISKKTIEELINKMRRPVDDNALHVRRVDGLFLNGYPVDVSYALQLQASELRAVLSDFVVPQAIAGQIASTIIKNFSAAEEGIIYETFSSAIHTALNELYGTRDTFSYMFFDTEDTEYYSRIDGYIRTQLRTRYGRAELKRQMVKERIAPDTVHARSLLEGYYRGILDEGTTNKIERLTRVEKNVFNDLMEAEVQTIVYPIFVFSSPVGSSFIQECLGDKGGVVYIKTDKFIPSINTSEYLEPTVQTYVCCFAAARYVNTLLR